MGFGVRRGVPHTGASLPGHRPPGPQPRRPSASPPPCLPPPWVLRVRVRVRAPCTPQGSPPGSEEPPRSLAGSDRFREVQFLGQLALPKSSGQSLLTARVFFASFSAGSLRWAGGGRRNDAFFWIWKKNRRPEQLSISTSTREENSAPPEPSHAWHRQLSLALGFGNLS